MPNKFKRNPTGTEADSLFRNSWAIDITAANTGGGPTSSTGLYNGVSIPTGGRVIYTPSGTAFTARTDAAFLEYIRSLNGNTSNINNAIIWASENGYLVVDKDFDQIPTNGLIIMLDATNTSSWDGKTWNDMSGTGNSALPEVGTITKGEVGILFDGVSSLQIPKSSSMDAWSQEQTIAIWMKHNFTSGRRNPWDQAYGGYGTWTHEQGGNINCYFGDAGVNNSPYTSANSSTTNRDVWNFMVTSRDRNTLRWYNNGALAGTRSHSYGDLTITSSGVRIGTGYAGYWIGEMGMVMAWDRALSQDEVNYVMNSTSNKFA
jgi:hypothetical protein